MLLLCRHLDLVLVDLRGVFFVIGHERVLLLLARHGPLLHGEHLDVLLELDLFVPGDVHVAILLH